jgi:predicted NUDIX family NTP pyrophosphohydrolase
MHHRLHCHLTYVLLSAVAPLALALWSAPAAHASGGFAPATDFLVGVNPASVAVGDFNGDADPDLAVTVYGGRVSVVLGRPGGGFGPPTKFAVGEAPSSIAVGDFNGDADPDLAVTNVVSDTVSILLGQPGGSFGPQATFATGPRPSSVAAGDFNGDGDPDLAVAESSNRRVSVRLGGPGASFGARTAFPVAPVPISIVVGDFNDDSDPDLAVADRVDIHGGVVSVLLGGLGGSFGAETTFPVGAAPSSVATGDFNGDADPDLAVATVTSRTVSVLLGEAGGSFGGQTSFATGGEPSAVAVGDFNADADPDLAVANRYSNTVEVRLGGPGGSFGPQITYPVRPSPQSIAVGDFDADADPDLAVTAGPKTVSVFLNTGAWHAALDRASISFPPTPAGDESERRTVVLTNIGSTDLSLSGVAITGADAGGFVVSDDTCSGATLAPGDTCSVRTRFRPLRLGSHSARLEFTDSAQDSLPSVVLSGTGTEPVTLSPTSIAWQPRPVGTQSHYRTVTLTNHMRHELAVDSLTLAGADASSFQLSAANDECTGSTVPAGGTCEALVRFRPDGVGPKRANLVFTDDAVTSPHTVALSGTGTAAAVSPLASRR